jgi:hypothetical protein
MTQIVPWIQSELKNCDFNDKRLGSRFIKILTKLAENIGESIPMACQDWANTKAAYRFLSNKNFTEKELLEGHFCATAKRYNASAGKVLVLHDTCEFSYNQKKNDIGIITALKAKKQIDGRTKEVQTCGILMHASLAITTDGVPLGLSAIKFWSRKEFKGTTALKRKINPTRIPIEKKESFRWIQNLKLSTDRLGPPSRVVHIGDRESDIYEYFIEAKSTQSNFISRICVNRRDATGNSTIHSHMKNAKIRGKYKISFKDSNGATVKTNLKIKYKEIMIQPPEGKRKRYEDIRTTVITATEIETRKKGRELINWKLITNLSVNSIEDAIEKLQWYALRWKIEVYFKVIKSGCKAEESKLRTADRVAKIISIYSLLSWRIFWLTMINRESSNLPPEIGFTSNEILILDKLVPDNQKIKKKKNLKIYLTKLAQLGGYLARNCDPPPGNKVIWKGLSKLNDIHLGVSLGIKLVGN